jgi:poly-gamma-glutamate capsule biosynthesis protein CapA/YwtB (metallophosphatase superfamily)
MIKILFAGDFLPPETNDNIYSNELRNLLKDKDYSIVNLETPLTYSNNPIEKLGNNFKRKPEVIKHIREGCFDAVTLSNNHIRDYGDQGVTDTLATCNKNNIQTVGAGININDASKPLRLKIKGKKIAILNYSEKEFNIATENQAGANPYDTVTVYYDIQNENKENDYVLVVYHGGVEYQYYPTLDMIKQFKYMIDIGADIVIAHHSHRYSGSITYKNRPLIFGLGNFLGSTNSKVTDEWRTGLILKINLNNELIDFSYESVRMNRTFDYVDLVENGTKNEIYENIKHINNVIQNSESLHTYWENKHKESLTQMVRLIKSYSITEYRTRKYIPLLFRNSLGDYKKKILLNMLRCESHRNKLINILEMLNDGN